MLGSNQHVIRVLTKISHFISELIHREEELRPEKGGEKTSVFRIFIQENSNFDPFICERTTPKICSLNNGNGEGVEDDGRL